MTARLAGLAALLLLAGCEASTHDRSATTLSPFGGTTATPAAATTPQAAAPVLASAEASRCGDGADTLLVTAERGIGGTGIVQGPSTSLRNCPLAL